MKRIFILLFSGIVMGLITTRLMVSATTSSEVLNPLPVSRFHITPSPTHIAVGIPKKLIIPKLSIHAEIESVTKDAEGRMDIPKKVDNVAWYSLGVKPGEKGNAVIDGHVDTPQGTPAVFADLLTLKLGDTIQVEDEHGYMHTFAVTKIESYELSSMPLEEIFATNSDKPHLNLITCDGTWSKTNKTYSHRLVVYSEETF